MGKIVGYLHHNKYVFVDEELKGKHRGHCLCWRCEKFIPEDRDKNCARANLLYAFCVAFDMTTPAYECPIFVEKPLVNKKQTELNLETKNG